MGPISNNLFSLTVSHDSPIPGQQEHTGWQTAQNTRQNRQPAPVATVPFTGYVPLSVVQPKLSSHSHISLEESLLVMLASLQPLTSNEQLGTQDLSTEPSVVQPTNIPNISPQQSITEYNYTNDLQSIFILIMQLLAEIKEVAIRTVEIQGETDLSVAKDRTELLVTSIISLMQKAVEQADDIKDAAIKESIGQFVSGLVNLVSAGVGVAGFLSGIRRSGKNDLLNEQVKINSHKELYALPDDLKTSEAAFTGENPAIATKVNERLTSVYEPRIKKIEENALESKGAYQEALERHKTGILNHGYVGALKTNKEHLAYLGSNDDLAQGPHLTADYIKQRRDALKVVHDQHIDEMKKAEERLAPAVKLSDIDVGATGTAAVQNFIKKNFCDTNGNIIYDTAKDENGVWYILTKSENRLKLIEIKNLGEDLYSTQSVELAQSESIANGFLPVGCKKDIFQEYKRFRAEFIIARAARDNEDIPEIDLPKAICSWVDSNDFWNECKKTGRIFNDKQGLAKIGNKYHLVEIGEGAEGQKVVIDHGEIQLPPAQKEQLIKMYDNAMTEENHLGLYLHNSKWASTRLLDDASSELEAWHKNLTTGITNGYQQIKTVQQNSKMLNNYLEKSNIQHHNYIAVEKTNAKRQRVELLTALINNASVAARAFEGVNGIFHTNAGNDNAQSAIIQTMIQALQQIFEVIKEILGQLESSMGNIRDAVARDIAEFVRLVYGMLINNKAVS